MNVSKVLTTAILRQLVTTLKEVSPVRVTMDSQGMDPLAQVNAYVNLFLQYFNKLCTYNIRAVEYII